MGKTTARNERAYFNATVKSGRKFTGLVANRGDGVEVECTSWQGKLSVRLRHEGGRDVVRVRLIEDGGAERTLYSGPLGPEDQRAGRF